MRLCLAGAEEFSHILKRARVKSSLISYWYLKDKGEDEIARLLDNLAWDEDCFVLLYSGAFSFHERAREELPRGKQRFAERYVLELYGQEIEEYLRGYLDFLKRWGERFSGYVELDLGPPEEKTRLRMWFHEEGLDPIPVFHQRDPFSYLIKLMEDYPYIALGAVANVPEDEVKRISARIFRRAREYGVKLHGLGMTKIELMKRFPWYSVDSITWISSVKYGRIPWYSRKRRKLVVFGSSRQAKEGNLQPLGKIRMFRRELEAEGIDVDKLLSEDYEEVLFTAAVAYRNLEEAISHSRRERKETNEKISKAKRESPYRPKPPELTPEALEKRKRTEEGRLPTNLTLGISAKRLPGLRCDNCYLSEECPYYEEGASCKLAAEFSSLTRRLTGSKPSLVDLLLEKLRLDAKRYHRGVVFEEASGGVIDKTVTSLSYQISRDIALLAKLQGFIQEGPGPIVVDQRRQQLIINQLANLSSEDRTELLETLRAALTSPALEKKEVN